MGYEAGKVLHLSQSPVEVELGVLEEPEPGQRVGWSVRFPELRRRLVTEVKVLDLLGHGLS
jgi:hypothetical protein